MTLAFFTNFINHHQVPLADEFYKLLGDNYKFVATMPLPTAFKNNGYSDFERPYLIKAYESNEAYYLAKQIAFESDVVILGSAPVIFLQERLKCNKLSFRYSERWFKNFWARIMNPFTLFRDHYAFINKPLYMLAASGYTVRDVNSIGLYRNKVFRWGYFTVSNDNHNVKTQSWVVPTSKRIQLMWCARFVKFKHPEMCIQLARRLKDESYHFVIDMFGSGIELEKIKTLVNKLDVEDVVNFCGNLPNTEILEQMRNHDIFLFTSDQNEGWGAVLNEAMANGCTPVASNMIGSVPFLIEDGVNGSVFKSENLDSLVEKVKHLLDNHDVRRRMSQKAKETMQNLWSPEHAASSFLRLVDAIQMGNNHLIPKNGPCSKAERI